MKLFLAVLFLTSIPVFAQRPVYPGGGGGGGGTGTVTSVSVTTANGVSGTVATPTVTPAITLTLGAITPTSTNGVSAATMAFLDATSSVQTQLNGKASSTATLTLGSTVLTLGGTVTSVSGLTLVAPALGTPLALVLTNATGLPAAQVSSGALVNGMTATTQSANDNSTKLATTAYVDGKTSDFANIMSSVTPTGCTISGKKCTTTGAVASVTLATIPGTFSNLKLTCSDQDSSGQENLEIQLNGDVTAGDYAWAFVGSGTTSGNGYLFGGWTSVSGNIWNTQEVDIYDYTSTTKNKTYYSKAAVNNTSPVQTYSTSGQWLIGTPVAVTSILIFPAAGNFAIGTSCSLDGWN